MSAKAVLDALCRYETSADRTGCTWAARADGVVRIYCDFPPSRVQDIGDFHVTGWIVFSGGTYEEVLDMVLAELQEQPEWPSPYNRGALDGMRLPQADPLRGTTSAEELALRLAAAGFPCADR